ncbi:MAG: hypothetical protein EOP83_05920 [Verrucomicrobiaceae bacterium]|nr:MAG: hypothetical protein EOP83_05920 [Verrucomicrobiaceae bacterium]
MSFLEEDDEEFFYDPVDPDERHEDPIMRPHEAQMLKTIARFDALFTPDEIAEDMRYMSESEENQAISEVVKHAYDSRLFRKGYFNFDMPVFDWKADRWIFPASITNLGYEAYKTVSRDVFWNITRAKPDYLASIDYYTEVMDQVSIGASEEVFKRIDNLRHSCYDRLRERIPEERARLWEGALRASSDPTGSIWNSLYLSQLDGLETLKERRVEFHVSAYLRGIQRADNIENYLLQPHAIMSIPRDSRYDCVRTAIDARVVAIWIARVQKITDPNDKLFARVEALPEEQFHLVKAEAFLQKMKCWTPLDEKGRRT